MAITLLHGSTDEKVPCALCGRWILLARATAGGEYADGEQAFACEIHSWSRTELIVAWMKFAIRQQQATHLTRLRPLYDRRGRDVN